MANSLLEVGPYFLSEDELAMAGDMDWRKQPKSSVDASHPDEF